MVPTYIVEIAVSIGICKEFSERLLLHTTTAAAGNRSCKTNVTASSVVNEVPRLPMIEITGLTLTTIPGGADLDQQAAGSRNISHKMAWAPDADLMSPQVIRELCSPPNLSGSATSQDSYQSYDQVVKYEELLAHKKSDLHTLEIGAGFGEATLAVLEALTKNGRKDWQYCCTSRGADALTMVKDSPSSWKDLITFKELDIEGDPQSQGFQAGYDDLIVTADILDNAIRNMRKLLRPGGRLLLQRSTRVRLDRGCLVEDPPRVNKRKELPRHMFSYASSNSFIAYEVIRSEPSAKIVDQWGSAPLGGFSALENIVATATDDASCAPTPHEIRILGPASPSPASESLSSALCTLQGDIVTASSTDICALPELSTGGKVCICLAELEGSILDSCNQGQWTSIQKMLSSASRVL